MNRHVLMPLLETVVLPDVVKIVAADDDRAVHLGLDDDAGENATADRDIAGERALLVNVVTLASLRYNGLLKNHESKRSLRLNMRMHER